MQRRPRPRAGRALAAAALACLVAGCGTGGPDAGRPPLRLVQVPWTESVAMNHLVSRLVTSRLGRTVEVLRLQDADAAFAHVASGKADAFLNAWLPTTHARALARYGPDLEDLGPIYSGARIGLVVDAGSPAGSIADLQDHPELLPEKMVGLDTDSGILGAAQRAAEVYGLEYEVVEAGPQELEAHIRSNLEDDGRVVFAGWRPHRRFRRQALRFLADPEGVFGGPEDIGVVARRGFAAEEPELARLLGALSFDTASFEDLLDTVTKKKAETAARIETWRLAEAARVEQWFETAGLGGAPEEASRSR